MSARVMPVGSLPVPRQPLYRIASSPHTVLRDPFGLPGSEGNARVEQGTHVRIRDRAVDGLVKIAAGTREMESPEEDGCR